MKENLIMAFSLFPFNVNSGKKKAIDPKEILDEIPLRQCRATGRMSEYFSSNASSPETIITFLIPYDVEGTPSHRTQESNLCRYARLPDYHHAISNITDSIIGGLEKIFPANHFMAFADNSPFYEVALAAASGLGVIGDNGLLISDLFGSWVFIATIVCDVALSPAEYTKTELSGCLKCGKCEKACPSSCIGPTHSEAGNLPALECLSAVTQRKGDIGTFSTAEIDLIQRGGSAWGCDVCAEVCPMNQNKLKSPHPMLMSNPGDYILRVNDAILDDLSLAENALPRAWDWRGEKVLRRNLVILDKLKAD